MSSLPRWAAAAAVLAAGCGGTGSLSGVVTYKGKPVVCGQVTAVTGDEGPRVATIGTDGRYRIDGVPTGPVKLAVESPDPSLEVDRATRKKKARPPGWVPLPAKYADVKTSGRTFDVRSGGNAVDLNLD